MGFFISRQNACHEVLEIGQDKLKEEELLFDCTNEKFVVKDQYIEQTVSA